jgi:septum formation protein
MKRIILASTSPRRKDALDELNIPYLSVVIDLDESKEIEGLEMNPEGVALHLSHKKAEFVANEFPDEFVLGMDTIVVLDNEIIGKPKDDRDAIRILAKLNGRWHTVMTGVTLINKEKEYEDQKLTKTEVKFARHCIEFIEEYVSKGESSDKAGAYAIQGKGKHLVEDIKGDYSNVVGFPKKTVMKMLRKAKFFS